MVITKGKDFQSAEVEDVLESANTVTLQSQLPDLSVVVEALHSLNHVPLQLHLPQLNQRPQSLNLLYHIPPQSQLMKALEHLHELHRLQLTLSQLQP